MKLKLLTLLATGLFAVSAQSAVFGQYESFSKSEFDNQGGYAFWSGINAVRAQTAGAPSRGIPENPFICVDGRQVPGFVGWDGYCYVEYKKVWRNSNYSILKHSSASPGKYYTWKSIGKDYKLTGNEVTAGNRDSGEFTYHCIAYKWVDFPWVSTNFVGKYVPNQNRCYVPTGTKSGDRTHIDINNSDGALILVEQ